MTVNTPLHNPTTHKTYSSILTESHPRMSHSRIDRLQEICRLGIILPTRLVEEYTADCIGFWPCFVSLDVLEHGT